MSWDLFYFLVSQTTSESLQLRTSELLCWIQLKGSSCLLPSVVNQKAFGKLINQPGGNRPRGGQTYFTSEPHRIDVRHLIAAREMFDSHSISNLKYIYSLSHSQAGKAGNNMEFGFAIGWHLCLHRVLLAKIIVAEPALWPNCTTSQKSTESMAICMLNSVLDCGQFHSTVEN